MSEVDPLPPQEEGGGAESTTEAYVETVDDGIDMSYDDNTYSYFTIIKYSILHYLSNPWALLILAFLIYKLYGAFRIKYINPLLDRVADWRELKKMEEEAALIKKNPDQFRSRMEQMESARAKLQEKYQQSTDQWLIKQQELEEKRRQQDIEDWENHQQGKGYKNRAGDREDKEREALEKQAKLKKEAKSSLRPDYNPLMGSGSGSNYRAARRNFSRGG